MPPSSEAETGAMDAGQHATTRMRARSAHAAHADADSPARAVSPEGRKLLEAPDFSSAAALRDLGHASVEAAQAARGFARAQYQRLRDRQMPGAARALTRAGASLREGSARLAHASARASDWAGSGLRGSARPHRDGPTSRFGLNIGPDAFLRAITALPRSLYDFFRFRTITSRVVLINVFVFAGLLGAVFYVSKAEEWLVAAQKEQLTAKGQIIAAAVAQQAMGAAPAVDTQPVFDPISGIGVPRIDGLRALEYSLDPQRIAPTLNRLTDPAKANARIYDTKQRLVLDSDQLRPGRRPATASGPAIESTVFEGLEWRTVTWLRSFFPRDSKWAYRDSAAAAHGDLAEVTIALQGQTTPILTVNERGQHSVSIALPIEFAGTTGGALVLSMPPGQFDQLIASEYRSISQVGLFALILLIASSVYFAGTIGRPLHQLGLAANEVRNNLARATSLPDYSHRVDEVGHLSQTLNAMTQSLYRRIETSERFAADVAHELKNPLTSVRGAAQRILNVKSEAEREKYAKIIIKDTDRLKRLIDDISSACRAEAELALVEMEHVDMQRLLKTVGDMFNDCHAKNGQRVILDVAPDLLRARDGLIVEGHGARLGQVVSNLLSNALSFSPHGGRVWIRVRRGVGAPVEMRRRGAAGVHLVISIEDEGPGIPAASLESIFDRFYTDRPPTDGFGNNSGLGLSISREIVEAHGGSIHAENRYPSGHGQGEPRAQLGGQLEGQKHPMASATPQDGQTGWRKPDVIGARFVIKLPFASQDSANAPAGKTARQDRPGQRREGTSAAGQRMAEPAE